MFTIVNMITMTICMYYHILGAMITINMIITIIVLSYFRYYDNSKYDNYDNIWGMERDIWGLMKGKIVMKGQAKVWNWRACHWSYTPNSSL